jgi:hypothetical protein
MEMKTNTKIRSMVVAIALIVTTAACAGLNESNAYKFETVGQPVVTNSGSTLTVRMVNASNGQPVTNAEVFAVHAVFLPSTKTVPSVQWVRTPLKPDGHGDYLYEGANLNGGATLRLTARLPGTDAQIVGTVETGGRKSTPS